MSAAIRNPEFRALWVAEAQSVLGDHLTTVALAIMVYDRTGSALWAAIVYALTFLPALAGGLGLSQIADRYPRRTVLVVAATIQAGLVALMAIPGTPLALLCVLVVFVRLVGAPVNAAQNALTREVFTDDELYLRSQDLRGITSNIAILVGLGGGGLLVTAVGPSWALALDAVSFLVAALVVRLLVRRRPAAGAPDDAWFGAVQWVFGQRRLRVLLAFSWLVGLAVIPEGLAAPLAHQIGAADQAVGWLLAADPVGFIIGTFILSRFVSAENRRRVMGALATAASAFLIAFAIEPSLPVALVLLALAGAAGAYIITVGATFITWVPNELRGGAGGVYRTGLRVAQGIGVALGGVLADLVGSATTAIAIAGIAGVVCTIPVALSWTKVRTAQETATPGLA
ncbi:arabinose ABC transporter permease [Prauserella marina]|uniref:Predicted arabinose efflux permease, MFS family n=1 Tax=Prauserella marina TaxID=530584 RepID=A0A222VV80_9PSEU|nr:MFS transporter [Prauserella marina]ASR37732.1 arabinose ABC transporter permease [Prauserella marina]PWV75673.1 putative MFS family arabinose efflux permease [Prauserella marina]SDD29098.1 Predicted arabinose efflux permease, MFS family [Prauserella marina]